MILFNDITHFPSRKLKITFYLFPTSLILSILWAIPPDLMYIYLFFPSCNKSAQNNQVNLE